jgi:hypothetical protein
MEENILEDGNTGFTGITDGDVGFTGSAVSDGSISIPYTKTNGKYSFSDEIILSPEERLNLTDEQIEQIMENRFSNWLNIVTYVPPETLV